MAPSGGNLTIKRKIQTKHKLPTLNWIVLKPNQVHYNDDINQYLKKKQTIIITLLMFEGERNNFQRIGRRETS